MGFRENREDLSYNRPKLELYGISGFQKFSLFKQSGFGAGILLNISSSEYGRGRESILRLGWLEEEASIKGNNFLYLTLAYAWIRPPGMEARWIEEIRSQPKEKEYFKVFFSSGLVF
jgi:hypothetical protein